MRGCDPLDSLARNRRQLWVHGPPKDRSLLLWHGMGREAGNACKGSSRTKCAFLRRVVFGRTSLRRTLGLAGSCIFTFSGMSSMISEVFVISHRDSYSVIVMAVRNANRVCIRHQLKVVSAACSRHSISMW